MVSLLNIIKREFKSYFLSPIAYIVIVVFLAVTGWFFFSGFFLAGRADLRGFFSLLPLIFSFVIPAITMRLFSEEFSSGSFEILFTLPVNTLDIVMGKFFAAIFFVVLMLVPTVSYPIFISSLGELDWGPVVGGYLGAILLGVVYCSIGLFASSLTKNQIVAFIVALAICFFLTMIDKMLFFLPSGSTGFFQFLGADFHFRNIARGVLDSRDLIYFLSVSFLALFGTYLVLEQKK